MNIKRHRLGKLKRHRASPMLIRMMRQAQTIALQGVLLKEARDRIDEFRSELRHWTIQYGCECAHPACSICKDTHYALQLVNL